MEILLFKCFRSQSGTEITIDGVYSALVMPKMGGIELLKALRNIRKKLPFVSLPHWKILR